MEEMNAIGLGMMEDMTRGYITEASVVVGSMLCQVSGEAMVKGGGRD